MWACPYCRERGGGWKKPSRPGCTGCPWSLLNSAAMGSGLREGLHHQGNRAPESWRTWKVREAPDSNFMTPKPAVPVFFWQVFQEIHFSLLLPLAVLWIFFFAILVACCPWRQPCEKAACVIMRWLLGRESASLPVSCRTSFTPCDSVYLLENGDHSLPRVHVRRKCVDECVTHLRECLMSCNHPAPASYWLLEI